MKKNIIFIFAIMASCNQFRNCNNIIGDQKQIMLECRQASNSKITNQSSLTNPSISVDGTIDSSNGEKIMVCIDFDKTILNEHAHDTLYRKGCSSSWFSSVWGIIEGNLQSFDEQSKQFNECNKDQLASDRKTVVSTTSSLFDSGKLSLRDPEHLKNMLVNFLNQGHKIAITTFSSYPDAIMIALKVLGLNEKQINKIIILGGMDPDDGRNGKMYHINKAKELARIGDNHNVILVDDDSKNIDVAKKYGVKAIHVDDVKFSWNKVTDVVKEIIKNKT